MVQRSSMAPGCYHGSVGHFGDWAEGIGGPGAAESINNNNTAHRKQLSSYLNMCLQ